MRQPVFVIVSFLLVGVLVTAALPSRLGAAERQESAPAAAAAASQTVWDGVYTEEQAKRGQAQYTTTCVECHGEDLNGGWGPGLVGESLKFQFGGKTLTDLFNDVRTMMPPDNPGSIPDEAYRDIIA